jgi:hypothetical protein
VLSQKTSAPEDVDGRYMKRRILNQHWDGSSPEKIFSTFIRRESFKPYMDLKVIGKEGLDGIKLA